MKLAFFLLLGTLALASEAVASRNPKALNKRAFAHSAEAKKLNPHMRFRHNPPPLPMLDLKARNPEKFKTVRASRNYKFK